MKIRKFHFVFSLILGIAISMGSWHTTKAWVSDGIWGSSTQYYRFASSVPSAYRPYINRGANAWTNVTPSS